MVGLEMGAKLRGMEPELKRLFEARVRVSITRAFLSEV